MLLSTLLLPLLLQAVAAAPTQDATTALDASSSDSDHVRTEQFTTSDGETYEILINGALVDDTAPGTTPAMHERQTTVMEPLWFPDGRAKDECGSSSFIKDTGPNAPTTGRCRVLMEWAKANNGFFKTYNHHHANGRATWLLKTHPSGKNACAFWIKHDATIGYIGNTDVADLIRDSLKRFEMNFSGAWRVRARGETTCNGYAPGRHKASFTWWVDNE
ncbi:putative Class V chitinase [Colletotrichum higginsianum IMI 349063]|nr:putative Class V chitinase [Colletotrichum higginsianum IMI 349063]OBR08177.1 putative Class V chitinase [Colletotrichum higginsianum IMI 349063]TIC91770.1 hypothetical protein CH35J_011031 [Colletotrichum higginsianum]GJD05180.1 putative class V chitinase [Colletotrichum higginsianum]